MALLLVGIGPQEVLILCVAALILFGASKVPQFMRGVGQGVKEFKQAIKDEPEAGKGAEEASKAGKEDA